MKLQVVTTTGKRNEIEVSKAVFGEKPNSALLSQAVRVYLSNQRQGTSKTKTRSDVNKTKKKWYRQKGTGGARHGARTPSIFVGGGVSHGPTGMTDWTLSLTASQRRKAMIYALSAQAKNTVVAPELSSLSGKTKQADALLTSLVPKAKHILIVLERPVEEIVRATNNLEHVLVTQASRMNVYETLLADMILITEEAVHALEKRLTLSDKSEKIEPATTVKTVESGATQRVEVAPAVSKKVAASVKAVKPIKQIVPKAPVHKAASVKATASKRKTA